MVDMKSGEYSFKSGVWVYPGDAPWYFVNVPKKESTDMKGAFGARARGWGSIPVTVIVGKTSWETSVFPDKKSGLYMLPIKASVRRAEGIKERDEIKIKLIVRL